MQRHLGMDDPVEQAELLEPAQRLGQHLGADPFQLLMRNPPSARDEHRLFKPRIEGSGIMHFALFRTCG